MCLAGDTSVRLGRVQVVEGFGSPCSCKGGVRGTAGDEATYNQDTCPVELSWETFRDQLSRRNVTHVRNGLFRFIGIIPDFCGSYRNMSTMTNIVNIRKGMGIT